MAVHFAKGLPTNLLFPGNVIFILKNCTVMHSKKQKCHFDLHIYLIKMIFYVMWKKNGCNYMKMLQKSLSFISIHLEFKKKSHYKDWRLKNVHSNTCVDLSFNHILTVFKTCVFTSWVLGDCQTLPQLLLHLWCCISKSEFTGLI